MAPDSSIPSNPFRPLILLLSLLIVLRLLPSCSTEIDVTADWKETTFVMALLRTDEQEHFIRIHKAFLDKERDAFVIASIQDSIYYKNLSVKVLKQRNNQTVETYNCERIDTALMEPGLFAHPDMLLYRFLSPGFLDSSFTSPRLLHHLDYYTTPTFSPFRLLHHLDFYITSTFTSP